MEADPVLKSTSTLNINLTIISYVKFTFIGYFIIGLSLGVLPVFIHNQLGYSAMIAGIVISLQYLSTFLFRGFAGKVIDKKGPKPAVLSSMISFAISGLFLLVAFSLREYHGICLALLAITRLVTGIGEGLVGASPIAWAINAAGDKHTAKAISFNGIANYGALAAGAPVGILLANAYGIGVMGIVIVLIGVIGYFLARQKESIQVTTSEPGKSFFAVLKIVAPYGIGLGLGGLGFGAISTFITLYYAYLNWSNAVLCLAVFSTFFILGRLIFANAINNYGGLKTAMVCLATESVGLLILWLANAPHFALIGAGISGLGFSLVFPALGVEAVKLAPASNKGAALGAYGLFIDISLGLTGPLIGGVASHFGMQYIFPFSMGMVLVGFLLCVFLKSQRKADQAPVID